MSRYHWYVLQPGRQAYPSGSDTDKQCVRAHNPGIGFETHVDLPSGVYNNFSTGIWCLKHEKVKLNTPVMSECITKHD
jgi:hypothetical protein